MKYPKTFIDRVAAEYGEKSSATYYLRQGELMAGRVLDDSSQGGISPADVVDAFESGSTTALLKTAYQLLRRQALYQEWQYNQRRLSFPDKPDQWGTLPEGGETWPVG